jgi:phosphatidylglycerophosphatase C
VSGAVAAFDFDGTLTARDTIWPFLRAVAGRGALARGLPRTLPVLAGRGLGLVGPTPTKARLFQVYLRGRRLQDVADAATRFARDELPALVRPDAIARVRWHQARGDRCVVVSASPELYIRRWAAAEGLEAIGTRLEVDAADRLTGRYDGRCCDGAEKVRRLRDLIGPGDRELFAYGDSRGDREILAMARHAYWRVIPRSEVP